MKKGIVVFISVLLLFLFAGCRSTVQGSDGPTAAPTVSATEQPTPEPTPEPTAEPTPVVTPEPTPDPDPLGRLTESIEVIEPLFDLWPQQAGALSDHGRMTTYDVNSQFGFELCSLNANFETDEEMDALVERYQELVVGEWEESEYSAGPAVYGGMIGGAIKATCQVYSDSMQHVFLGVSVDEGSTVLDALLAEHWPIGLLVERPELNEENLHFQSLSYEAGNYVSIGRSWRVESGESTEVIDFYKDALADCENYIYDGGNEYTGPSVGCAIGGVNVMIRSYDSGDSESTVEITLTRAVDD